MERIETERLVLRRPRTADAEAIFERYASDPDVTRFVSFARHRSLDDTLAFLAYSDDQWTRWPAGPYLIEARADGLLLGGTGVAFETPTIAATGYVLARDAWGIGVATEALRAMVNVATTTGVRRLYALCHPEHRPSQRVLEKCDFTREALLPRHTELPNLRPGEPSDVLRYVLELTE